MSSSGQILVLEGPLSERTVELLARQGRPLDRCVVGASELLSEVGKGAALVVLDVLAPGKICSVAGPVFSTGAQY